VPIPSLQGQLLVASPDLDDPNFRRSVILILEHTSDGALGVMLNRRLGVSLDEAATGWGIHGSEPRVVFDGGPVQRDATIALGRLHHPCVDADAFASPILGDLVSIDLDAQPDLVDGLLVDLRVFFGYAGWSAGQLDAEIKDGGWIVIEAEPSDTWTDDPDVLWRSVLSRQGWPVAAFASFPEDPGLN